MKILKPIRSRHVAASESDVAHFSWNCSDQEDNLIRAAISERWPTNPLAEHLTISNFRPTSLRLRCSGCEADAFRRPPQESLMLLGRTPDQGNGKLNKPWTAQQLTKAKELGEHVHYTTTAGETRPIRLQLAGTKGTWQGHAAAVTAALQVSDDVTTFLDS